MQTEHSPNFSEKSSVPKSDSAPSATPDSGLTEPESSVSTAGQHSVNSSGPAETAECLFFSSDEMFVAWKSYKPFLYHFFSFHNFTIRKDTVKPWVIIM